MKLNLRIDWWLIAPIAVLVVISLTTLLSVNAAFFRSQLISLLVAILAFIFFTYINLEVLKQLKIPIYVISIILLVIVLIVGSESRGAVRWMQLFGISIQFSE